MRDDGIQYMTKEQLRTRDKVLSTLYEHYGFTHYDEEILRAIDGRMQAKLFDFIANTSTPEEVERAVDAATREEVDELRDELALSEEAHEAALRREAALREELADKEARLERLLKVNRDRKQTLLDLNLEHQKMKRSEKRWCAEAEGWRREALSSEEVNDLREQLRLAKIENERLEACFETQREAFKEILFEIIRLRS